MVQSLSAESPLSPAVHAARLDGFKADIWADAPELAEAYRRLDQEALSRTFKRAVRAGDLKRVALAGPRLFAAGLLSRPEAFLLGRALTAEGRHAEAVEVLAGPGLARHPNPKYIKARAAALAAAGRPADALAATEEALARHPEFSPWLDGTRQSLVDIQAVRAPATWPEAHRLASAWLTLGAAGPAAPLLSRFGEELSGDALLDWAALALRACPAEDVLARLEREPEPARSDLRWRTLSVAAAALSEALQPPAEALEGPADANLRLWRAIGRERGGQLDLAIAELSELAEVSDVPIDVRHALARCIGRRVLTEVRPSFAPGHTGRIVNLVPFFNELGLLRLHLEEMAPWIDRFVIVEAAQTFTGHDKPLHFEANRGLFADFADKILHLPIRAFPTDLTSPWAREFHQRDMAIAGASGFCGEEDYILETDVDEIIDGRAVEGLEADFAELELRLSRYFLNYRPEPGNPQGSRSKCSIFKAKHLRRHGVSYGRTVLAGRIPDAHLVRQAGWHFTSISDAQGIALKIDSYSHQEQRKPQFRSAGHFQAVLDRLRAGELEAGWSRVELDDSFPAALLRNLEAFSDAIL